MASDKSSTQKLIEEIDDSFFEKTEEKMRSEFVGAAEVEARLTDIASALLVRTLERVGPLSTKGELGENDELGGSDSPETLILGACTFIGAHAVRVIRAARAVLASGFESEARALDRILVELMAHRKAILDDSSAGEAVAWLRRKRIHGISKRVGAMGDAELYGNLCVDAHGDPGAVMRLHNPETNTIELGPQRTAATRASLLLYAGFARDQAAVISKLSGNTVISGLDVLDAAIAKAWGRLKAEAESGSP